LSNEIAYTLGTSKKVSCFTHPPKCVVPAPGEAEGWDLGGRPPVYAGRRKRPTYRQG
jgi:hypothetical protein